RDDRFASAAEVVEVLGQRLAQLQQAAWVPPPAPSPSPAGANANAGLPTSLTLCPSCGASLHVPERMVGGMVHCPECGKPFRVEEGSEEIRVARAVPPPFGPRPAAQKRIPIWIWVAAGCAAVLFLILLGLVSYTAERRDSYHAASKVPPKPVPPTKMPAAE